MPVADDLLAIASGGRHDEAAIVAGVHVHDGHAALVDLPAPRDPGADGL
jgi:hypothetical protein